MNKSIETQIVEAEEQLRIAMLHSDVEMLDRLLASELIFTNHLGQVLSKQDDLHAHQSRLLNISKLTFSEQEIRLYQNMAITSVQIHLVGSYDGIPSDGDFRFTRVWIHSSNGMWQVIAAHSSIVS